MKILITNDDGAAASQLPNLIRFCRSIGEVTVVVPKFEQSCKSHSIEIHKPFEAKQVELEPGMTIWTVDSTPADCIRFAVHGLNLTFDLVISGINRGYNLGEDIMYSGTVSAACEAVNKGKKAIALSTSLKYYDKAAKHLDDVFRYIQENRLLEHNDLYNINIPVDPKGFRITKQSGASYSECFIPLGSDLFEPSGKPIRPASDDPTLDTVACSQGYISVTPMTINQTKTDVFHKLEHLNA